eukprot:6032258-Alexandrium_andersonii.AAC.1
MPLPLSGLSTTRAARGLCRSTPRTLRGPPTTPQGTPPPLRNPQSVAGPPQDIVSQSATGPPS